MNLFPTFPPSRGIIKHTKLATSLSQVKSWLFHQHQPLPLPSFSQSKMGIFTGRIKCTSCPTCLHIRPSVHLIRSPLPYTLTFPLVIDTTQDHVLPEAIPLPTSSHLFLLCFRSIRYEYLWTDSSPLNDCACLLIASCWSQSEPFLLFRSCTFARWLSDGPRNGLWKVTYSSSFPTWYVHAYPSYYLKTTRHFIAKWIITRINTWILFKFCMDTVPSGPRKYPAGYEDD